MADFSIKVGDRLPVFEAILQANGAAQSLVGAVAVRFRWRLESQAPSLTRVGTGAVVDAAAGRVKYEWGSTDTLVPGNYSAEWEVEWAGSKLQTFPSEGGVTFRVHPKV